MSTTKNTSYKENIKARGSELGAQGPVDEIVQLALREDLEPNGDISSQLFIDPKQLTQAKIIAKEPGILACSYLAQKILDAYCHCEAPWAPKQSQTLQNASISFNLQDGQSFKAGDNIATLIGPAQTILATERTILNFLQRLCAVATATHKLVELIKDYPCELLDTRKTMPGMRALEKQAFTTGGGTNHRFNLSDMIMLKENHLALSVIASFEEAKQSSTAKDTKIEVEINQDNLDKLGTILETSVDIIMLDNFSADEVAKLVPKIRSAKPSIKIEASGGIDESNIVKYAIAGVDYISISAVTTKIKSLDLSFLIIN